jgi:SAM-dependent methyltransferase
VCDWGCATGDGTDVLAQAYTVPVTGIDFSRTAIEVASQSYPGLSFKCVDLLTETIEERFDVLFCSNTLEHFPDPWDVLAKVAGVAEQALIVLIPFREFERHSEHEVTFDSGTVPIVAAGVFQLVYARVVDTAKLTPTYWPGEQLLLVYAKPSLIERCALRLDDIVIDTGALAKERARVEAVRRRLRAEIAHRERVAHEVGRDTVAVIDELHRAQALAERNMHAVKAVTRRLAGEPSGDDETT